MLMRYVILSVENDTLLALAVIRAAGITREVSVSTWRLVLEDEY